MANVRPFYGLGARRRFGTLAIEGASRGSTATRAPGPGKRYWCRVTGRERSWRSTRHSETRPRPRRVTRLSPQRAYSAAGHRLPPSWTALRSRGPAPAPSSPRVSSPSGRSVRSGSPRPKAPAREARVPATTPQSQRERHRHPEAQTGEAVQQLSPEAGSGRLAQSGNSIPGPILGDQQVVTRQTPRRRWETRSGASIHRAVLRLFRFLEAEAGTAGAVVADGLAVDDGAIDGDDVDDVSARLHAGRVESPGVSGCGCRVDEPGARNRLADARGFTPARRRDCSFRG